MQNERVHFNATWLASHVGNIPWPVVLGTWQVDWCHSVSWNHTNGDQLISVAATVFVTCMFCSTMFCYHLRIKAIRFIEKGPRSEIGASLHLHGLSISFMPRANLEITWLFILSWITVANEGFDWSKSWRNVTVHRMWPTEFLLCGSSWLLKILQLKNDTIAFYEILCNLRWTIRQIFDYNLPVQWTACREII